MRIIHASLLVCILALLGCEEIVDVHYANLDEARKAGMIGSERIPAWIPESAHTISAAHSVANDRSMLAAEYDASESIEWEPHCSQISPADVPEPPFSRPWWPGDIPVRFATHRHAFFECGNGSFAAWGQGEFYFWKPRGKA